MHSECKIRAKKQGVLEADGDMDVESLPLALRRYLAFVQTANWINLTVLDAI